MDRLAMMAASKCWCTMSSRLSRDEQQKNHLRVLPSFDLNNYIIALQCMCVGKVVCRFFDAHIHTICPVCDITHIKKMYQALSYLMYCKLQSDGLGTRLGTAPHPHGTADLYHGNTNRPQ